MYKLTIYYKSERNIRSVKKGLKQADDIYFISCVVLMCDCKKLPKNFMSDGLLVCFMSFQVSGIVRKTKLSFKLFHSNKK